MKVGELIDLLKQHTPETPVAIVVMNRNADGESIPLSWEAKRFSPIEARRINSTCLANPIVDIIAERGDFR